MDHVSRLGSSGGGAVVPGRVVTLLEMGRPPLIGCLATVRGVVSSSGVTSGSGFQPQFQAPVCTGTAGGWGAERASVPLWVSVGFRIWEGEEGGGRKAEACGGSFPVYTGGINGKQQEGLDVRPPGLELLHTNTQRPHKYRLSLADLSASRPPADELSSFHKRLSLPGMWKG